MLETEFDRVADAYHRQHAASIRLSGETPDYFARYKIDVVAREMAGQGRAVRRILDFGGGIGNSLPYLRAAFPDSEIVLLDPSRRSLDLAERRFPGLARCQWFDGSAIPFEDGAFDLVFTACVFHHIPEQAHVPLLAEIRRVLKPGAPFFLFEHNPFNPLTRHAVRNCPFDENAVLINARAMRGRMKAAGLADVAASYCVFFPNALAPLRTLERFLVKLPLGAQYYVRARTLAA